MIGWIFDLLDTYQECLNSGKLAVAIFATIMISIFSAFLSFVILSIFILLPLVGILAAGFITYFVSGWLITGMRENICK